MGKARLLFGQYTNHLHQSAIFLLILIQCCVFCLLIMQQCEKNDVTSVVNKRIIFVHLSKEKLIYCGCVVQKGKMQLESESLQI